MPALQVCTLAFPTRNGIGTQTITGVEDVDGNPFLGSFFLFHGGYVANNILTNSPGALLVDIGVADGATKGGAAGGGDLFQAGAKVVSGAVGGAYCVMDTEPNIQFGGFVDGFAYISDNQVGQFDLTWDKKDRDGDYRIVTVFGGDDLTVVADPNTANGTYATPAPPVGVFVVAPNTFSSTKSIQTAAGSGAGAAWGFDTKNSGRGGAIAAAGNQSGNVRGQLTDRLNVVADLTQFLGGTQVVSDWGSASYTITGGTSQVALQRVAFCGASIAATAGAVIQESGATQTITVDINPKWFFCASVGTPPNASIDNTMAQLSIGWTDQTRQGSYWFGETVSSNGVPLTGARYLSDTSLIRIGTPNGASTAFTAIATLDQVDPVAGTVTINWPTNDAVARQIVWFALGEAIVPPTPPPEPIFHLREVVRRRLRRAPIVWSEKDGLQTRVRVNLFAVDMQPGVGTRDTPDPQVMIRASKDGGFTWGNERRVSAGRVGEYFDRLNSWQWGQGRDWVFEVACTDPVTWNLVGAYLDAEGGTS